MRTPEGRRGSGRHALWIILAVRGEAAGKSRLAAVLDPSERMRLNRELLRRTLGVIEAWQGSLAHCIVVSPCARARAAAHARGAIALAEPTPRRGLNCAVALGVRRARRQGARRVLILPADLVRLGPGALRAMARNARFGARAAIAPDRGGSGTNALLLATGVRFGFAFGADSFVRHVEALRAHGYAVTVHIDPRLGFDLDTPQDLAAYLRSSDNSRRARFGR
ncbi:MAG: 2-phospho-L-lactate guanylyltransferase [Burkholderiales bacterium]|nr:2-phospho-L-lactate guanylyltransferase [Burkholderiales bacterium]